MCQHATNIVAHDSYCTVYKATFSIQIKHWKNMTALSNMPIIDRQDE